MAKSDERSWDQIVSDVPHPRRNYGFQNLPGEIQNRAYDAMAGVQFRGPELAELMRPELEDAQRKLAAAGNRPSPTQRRKVQVMTEATEAARSGLPPTGIDVSVKRVRDTAMAPVKAARVHAKETGELVAPLAGEYYPARGAIGRGVAEHSFGKGSEEALRHMLSSPELSARMAPQEELQGASGMATLLKQGEDMRFSFGPDAAEYLSTQLKGRNKNVPVESRDYDFNELARFHPQVASLMTQQGAARAGLVKTGDHTDDLTQEPTGETELGRRRRMLLAGDTSVHIPSHLEQPTAAFVRSMGLGGFPKNGRALARFYNDPANFGGFDQHKIGSYTWNSLSAGNEIMARGTHHFLGALAHGDAWFQAHPDAADHIRRAASQSAWNDPTSTIDVHSGRAASGLPYVVTRALGEMTNPEQLMGAVAGLGATRKGKGHPFGTTPDLGYLYGEEAHRQAGQKMFIRMPGGGRIHAPGHVVQSLSWYGIQAEENPMQLRGPNAPRTLLPTSMSDPRGLNPLEFPRVW